MDIPQQVLDLIRTTARGFYDTKHVILIECILKHKILRDDQIAILTGLKMKDLQRIAAKLREDGLIYFDSQTEIKQGHRQSSRVYYLINYQASIDSIKWRLHKIFGIVESKIRNDANRQGYVCPSCHQKFTALDAVTMAAPSGFKCKYCGNFLVQDIESSQGAHNHETLGRLMTQVEPIVKLLKEIDSVQVPDFSISDCMANMLPFDIDQSTKEKEEGTSFSLSTDPISKNRSFNIEVNFEDQPYSYEKGLSIIHKHEQAGDNLNLTGPRSSTMSNSVLENDNAISSFFEALKAKSNKEIIEELSDDSERSEYNSRISDQNEDNANIPGSELILNKGKEEAIPFKKRKYDDIILQTSHEDEGQGLDDDTFEDVT